MALSRVALLCSLSVFASLIAGACGSSPIAKRERPEAGGAGGEAGASVASMAGSPSGTAGVTGSSGGAGGESAVGGAAGEPNDISGAGAATEGGAGGQGGAGGASACEDGALKFSGAHYVDVPGTAALHLKTAMTLEAWVKTTDPVAVEAIFLGKHSCGTDNGYFLEIYTSSSDGPHVPNAPAFYVGANNQHAYGTASIVDGKWHHIAGTWDGATSKLYVDGAFVVSKAAAYVNTNPTNLGIGAVTGGTCRGFSGILDELSVWSVVRSAQEIAADAAAPVSKAAAGLEAYYDFNSSNCGQTLSDRSPHARDGVLGGSLMVEAADPQWVSDGPF